MVTKTKPLIAVVGETASGKSAVAMEIARRFNGEIICADSWTVYKGFDIGSAKPTKADQAKVRHHLLDITEANQGFNAALFKRFALDAINDVHKRYKLPVLVGGTGLYVDSVLYDYSFLPTVGAQERAMRNEKQLEELIEEAKSSNIDLTGIDIRNKRRVIRALETNGLRPSNTKLRPNSLIVGIGLSRETLLQRISNRFDSMLEQGLEQEVKLLQQKYGWDAEPMKGIGYKEWQLYFNGLKTIEDVRQQIIAASMQLAKRQRTWLKRNNSIQWVSNPKDAVDLATTFLNKRQ